MRLDQHRKAVVVVVVESLTTSALSISKFHVSVCRQWCGFPSSIAIMCMVIIGTDCRQDTRRLRRKAFVCV